MDILYLESVTHGSLIVQKWSFKLIYYSWYSSAINLDPTRRDFNVYKTWCYSSISLSKTMVKNLDTKAYIVIWVHVWIKTIQKWFSNASKTIYKCALFHFSDAQRWLLHQGFQIEPFTFLLVIPLKYITMNVLIWDRVFVVMNKRIYIQCAKINAMLTM